MQKVNKRRRKLQVGDKKTIRSFSKRLAQNIRYFRSLRKAGRLKKPYWFKSVTQTNLSQNANQFILKFRPQKPKFQFTSGVKTPRYTWKVVDKQTGCFRFKAKRSYPFLNYKVRVFGKKKSIFRPNFVVKTGKSFLGPRTLRHWWIFPARWHQFTFLYRLRRGQTRGLWYPKPKRNSLRKWLYLVKSIFKTIYGITHDRKLYNLIRLVSKKNKLIKLIWFFSNLNLIYILF